MITSYYAHCGQQWSTDWDCACNDECPVCSGEIEPYALSDTGDTLQLLVAKDWTPEGGLPEGLESVAELDGWPTL